MTQRCAGTLSHDLLDRYPTVTHPTPWPLRATSHAFITSGIFHLLGGFSLGRVIGISPFGIQRSNSVSQRPPPHIYIYPPPGLGFIAEGCDAADPVAGGPALAHRHCHRHNHHCHRHHCRRVIVIDILMSAGASRPPTNQEGGWVGFRFLLPLFCGRVGVSRR